LVPVWVHIRFLLGPPLLAMVPLGSFTQPCVGSSESLSLGLWSLWSLLELLWVPGWVFSGTSFGSTWVLMLPNYDPSWSFDFMPEHHNMIFLKTFFVYIFAPVETLSLKPQGLSACATTTTTTATTTSTTN